ncbi:hypothetical protein ABEG18_05405 [Alsobacter sp. KACC 23698]|uniref:Uncharacterized protein n=1 Tax=Alsobacter sp. KACC 23698 TaxID=3149229 RepID=A0AAU7JIG6_9HYPH
MIARINVRRSGDVRDVSACVLAGYAWLAVAAAILTAALFVDRPGRYDAPIHATMLGFVGSKVFGHALIVSPAMLRVRVRHAPVMYGPLTVLHLSVALRVGGGLASFEAARIASGVLTLVAFAGLAACVIVAGQVPARARPAGTGGEIHASKS